MTKLPDNLSMGLVELNVFSLEHMTNFYHDKLDLEIIDATEKFSILGHKGKHLIRLNEERALKSPLREDAGLYHFALVHEFQSELAKKVEHFIKTAPNNFQGSADHIVSEAFYFADPEGNGIELYYDRPRLEWEWEGDHIRMGSIYIDPDEYIEEHTKDLKKGDVHMGHIHLKVGDIEKAEEFYVRILGFDITFKMPGGSALFISAGRYHHHLGLNTWESNGAGERGKTLGLNAFEINISDKETLNRIKTELKKNNYKFESSEDFIEVNDPWRNMIRIQNRESRIANEE